MPKAVIRAKFAADRQAVWSLVTDSANQTWRSDLEQVCADEDGMTFTEVAKGGIRTRFAVTVRQPLDRYEFDLQNSNLSGHWTGVFAQAPGGGTEAEFTEEVAVKSPIMRLLAPIYLRRMQRQYVRDLKRALGEKD